MSRSQIDVNLDTGRLERVTRILVELRIPAQSVGDLRFDLQGQVAQLQEVTIGASARRRGALRLLELRRERPDGTLETIATGGRPTVPVTLLAGENVIAVVSNDGAAPATVIARAKVRGTLSGR